MEKKPSYVPKPLDTSRVEVPESLMELWEYLARNIHEVWAKERMDGGWTWGEQRDDTKKHHPDLISYEELTEGEKQFDRNTAMETIRTILALGYRIEKAEDDPAE